jgi:BioD-like phosphotransacetylase family protein
MGIECLGVIPYEPDLTFPTVDQLVQDCKLTVIRADDTGMMNHVQHNVVVAVSPERVTAGLKEDTMLIVPEGCLDLFRSGLAAISAAGSLDKVSCILFTDGIEPPDAVLEELAPCGVPLLTTSSDTFRMAAKLGSLIVKISPRDPVKVEAACDLMKAHLDIDRILAGL